jgi:predicted RNA-binding Zn-ribbon protein involved in translation (DUF1610 family)
MNLLQCWCGGVVNCTNGLDAMEAHLASEKHATEMRERCPECGMREYWHAARCRRIIRRGEGTE